MITVLQQIIWFVAGVFTGAVTLVLIDTARRSIRQQRAARFNAAVNAEIARRAEAWE